MKNNEVIEEPVQGTDSQTIEAPSLEIVEKWLTIDLKSAIMCLNAIQADPELLHMMAVWLKGRAENRMAQDKLHKTAFKGPKGQA